MEKTIKFLDKINKMNNEELNDFIFNLEPEDYSPLQNLLVLSNEVSKKLNKNGLAI